MGLVRDRQFVESTKFLFIQTNLTAWTCQHNILPPTCSPPPRPTYTLHKPVWRRAGARLKPATRRRRPWKKELHLVWGKRRVRFLLADTLLKAQLLLFNSDSFRNYFFLAFHWFCKSVNKISLYGNSGNKINK